MLCLSIYLWYLVLKISILGSSAVSENCLLLLLHIHKNIFSHQNIGITGYMEFGGSWGKIAFTRAEKDLSMTKCFPFYGNTLPGLQKENVGHLSGGPQFQAGAEM